MKEHWKCSGEYIALDWWHKCGQKAEDSDRLFRIIFSQGSVSGDRAPKTASQIVEVCLGVLRLMFV